MAILDMSAAPWDGEVKLLPDNATSPRTKPRLIILHTIVGDAERTWRYFRDGTNLESTFLVAGRWYQTDWPDGYAVQAMDTEREADANYRANPFAISIETEDDGTPNDTPWTSRQLDALAWLLKELARIHDIPLRKADRWDGSGVGWHAMWGAPSNWTPVAGKECPGRARIAQIPALIERARSGGQQGDLSMADAQDILTALTALRRDLTVYGTNGLEETVEAFATRQRQTHDKLEALDGRLDAQQRQIDALATAYDKLAALVADGGSGGGVVTDDQLTKVIAELRSGLAQPVGAHLSALLANAHRAAAEQLTQSGGLV